jgi:phage terminase large subunit GpA-like protein
MDAVNDPDVETIAVMKAAQVGASEALLNMLAFHIAHDPSPILFLQPTLEMAESFSKDRISTMIRDCPQLAALVADPKSRDAANTLLYKSYPGGYVALAGSNSPASLASRPIRVVLCDEIDRYPISIASEGDPLSLAIKRTATFWDRKIVMVSTPTVKGASRIEMAFKESDQRKFYVPCAHCNEMQILVWGQVKWTSRPPEEAQYCCAHCGSLWTEAERSAAVRAGEWRASASFTGCAGFHLSELVSPWRSLGEIAQDFVAAQAYPERLRTFVNMSLAESWEVAATAVIEPHALSVRAEAYALGSVPAGVGAVVAAVDTQGDRLEYYCWGFGEGEEAWILDRVILWGDPAHEIVWRQLLEQLDRPLTAAGGAQIVPRVIAIDSGGLHTMQVYSFAKHNAIRRTPFGLQTLLAVKGSSKFDAPILGVPTSQEVNWKGQRLAGGVKLWPVGSSAAKSLLYGRLKIETRGPGYIHFSTELPEEFYDQLTAERLVTKYLRGFGRLEWELQRGRRNEALDTFCYSYACAVHLGMHRMRPADWAKCREQLHGHAAQSHAATDPPAAVPVPPQQISEAERQRRAFLQGAPPPGGANWTTSWRR